MLTVEDLRVYFHVKRGLMGRRSYDVRAVDGVSFGLAHGQTLGLVGESGSGKSTIGRALLRLVGIHSGTIQLNGTDVRELRGRMLDFRRDLQAIFQDPYSLLNPSMIVADIVGEPLTIHYGLKGRQRDERVAQLLDQVGLATYHMERYPSEFSGGQRQRIAVARAIALEPQIIICDEAISALDVSTQSQVINLLKELQERLGLAYLFIAHDLAVVRHISDQIAVLYLGRIMEMGPAELICSAPRHPYTQLLISAIPVADPIEQKKRKAARSQLPPSELPSATNPPDGCPFHTRCPQAVSRCRNEVPLPRQVRPGEIVACHLID
ncbi:MAG: ABC transporter ATP-binding protein [Proteobacteria bacterium]|jgi:oligopeptide/dipeptide ABC transporter ATP-binding protein|nr:ABC transporter ATP-binding protein [Pseudomonadota bacterium]MDA1298559.1 ABC transporter ATP-binding protein [Pseudomonadota bacterium]